MLLRSERSGFALISVVSCTCSETDRKILTLTHVIANMSCVKREVTIRGWLVEWLIHRTFRVCVPFETKIQRRFVCLTLQRK